MVSRTGGNKLPYEWFWTPAMLHLGTYPCMNISQQLKLTIHTATAAVIHRFMTYDALLYTLTTQHQHHEVLQFLILALNKYLLSVPQVHTICIRDLISH